MLFVYAHIVLVVCLGAGVFSVHHEIGRRNRQSIVLRPQNVLTKLVNPVLETDLKRAISFNRGGTPLGRHRGGSSTTHRRPSDVLSRRRSNTNSKKSGRQQRVNQGTEFMIISRWKSHTGTRNNQTQGGLSQDKKRPTNTQPKGYKTTPVSVTTERYTGTPLQHAGPLTSASDVPGQTQEVLHEAEALNEQQLSIAGAAANSLTQPRQTAPKQPINNASPNTVLSTEPIVTSLKESYMPQQYVTSLHAKATWTQMSNTPSSAAANRQANNVPDNVIKPESLNTRTGGIFHQSASKTGQKTGARPFGKLGQVSSSKQEQVLSELFPVPEVPESETSMYSGSGQFLTKKPTTPQTYRHSTATEQVYVTYSKPRGRRSTTKGSLPSQQTTTPSTTSNKAEARPSSGNTSKCVLFKRLGLPLPTGCRRNMGKIWN